MPPPRTHTNTLCFFLQVSVLSHLSTRCPQCVLREYLVFSVQLSGEGRETTRSIIYPYAVCHFCQFLSKCQLLNRSRQSARARSHSGGLESIISLDGRMRAAHSEAHEPPLLGTEQQMFRPMWLFVPPRCRFLFYFNNLTKSLHPSSFCSLTGLRFLWELVL